MAGIITITFNPSLDKSIDAPCLEPDRKLHCSAVGYHPGGGGINISRVLKRLGENPVTSYLSGGFYGKHIQQLLLQEGIESNAIKIKAQTRENIIILDTSSGRQYLLDTPGPVIQSTEWQRLLKLVARQKAEFIAGSGSIPPGVPVDIYARLARIAHKQNAKLIIDTSGEALQHALAEKVFLIKPNLKELAHISGKENVNRDEAMDYAVSIIGKGRCKNIVVSLAAEGALLASEKYKLKIHAPVVNAVSTIGAGDSMTAGIIYGLAKRMTMPDAVKFGVACGTATTLHPGCLLANKEDIKLLYKKINNAKAGCVSIN